MSQHTPLKWAIFNSGKRQVEIARKTGIHESRLSKLAKGWAEPTEAEKKTLSRVLHMPPDELFPEVIAS
jgi:transcriptional regulator with XRE-family HTH domain